MTKKNKLACVICATFMLVSVGPFVVAQEVSRMSSPAAATWSDTETRSDLMSRSTEFFSSTQGEFVSKKAIVDASSSAVTPAQRTVADAEAGNLSTQFKHVFGGIPYPEIALAGGNKLYSACEPHDCVGRKAFMVTNSSGSSTLAAGFLGPRCGTTEHPIQGGCEAFPTLTIFYTDRKSRMPELTAEVVKWAREKVMTDQKSNNFSVVERFIH